MSDRGWRNVSLVLGLCCAVLLGISGALVLNAGGQPTASPTALSSASSTATPGASVPGSSASATNGASAGATSSPSATATATATATASPKPTQSAATATVRFVGMQLDAEKDPAGKARTFTFTSDGLGPVVARVVATSPQGTTKLCAAVDQATPSCWAGAKPAMPSGFADTEHSVWTFTLIGVDILTPTVDVEFSWPAAKPSIQLTHGRFQGTGSDVPQALNGFAATFKTRAAGAATLQASWPPLVTDAVVVFADMTPSQVIAVDQQQYLGQPAVAPAYSHDVEAGRTYRVELHNLAADQYRPDLTATIAFP